MNVKCLIVDDEPLAIRVITSYVERIPNLVLTASCRSGFEALEILQTREIDLVLLDIQMPGITGLDLIKSLKEPPSFIFTTAHRDFAVDAYDINALDYLLKPISFPRFLKAINKYIELQADTKKEPGNPEKKNIYLRANRKTYAIDPSHILFVEGLKDYVKVHLVNNKPLITKEKLSDMEVQLGELGFIRTHKSFIVQKSKISSYTNESIDINEFEIPIGRTYKEKVILELKR